MNPITLPSAELKPALTGLGKIINRHASLPVLSSIKVERNKEGWIGLTATDLDRFITVRLEQPAKGEPVAMLVPYEDLLRLVKSNGKNPITLEPGSHTSLPVEEFPATPKLKSDPIIVSEPLRRSIHEAMTCASEDPTRFILQGAYIDGNHIIATDGRHLYNANSWNLPLKSPVIIPKHKFLNWSEFNKDGGWQLKAENQFIQINSRRWRFITKRIEGQYPNWRQVLPDPKQVQSNIILDSSATGKLIKIIENLPCDNLKDFTLGLEWKDHHLSFMGREPQMKDWNKVLIPEAKGDGKDVTIFLNRQLLIKALEFGLNAISIIDSISPLRLHQGSREMIVMPVRAESAPQRLPAPQTPPPLKHHQRAPIPRAVEHLTKAPRIDDALDQVSTLRDSFRAGLAHLRDLAGKLKIIKTTQKTSEKEVQQARHQLRKIQDVKF